MSRAKGKGVPAEPPRSPRKVWSKSGGAAAVGELGAAAQGSGAGARPEQPLTRLFPQGRGRGRAFGEDPRAKQRQDGQEGREMRSPVSGLPEAAAKSQRSFLTFLKCRHETGKKKKKGKDVLKKKLNFFPFS